MIAFLTAYRFLTLQTSLFIDFRRNSDQRSPMQTCPWFSNRSINCSFIRPLQTSSPIPHSLLCLLRLSIFVSLLVSSSQQSQLQRMPSVWPSYFPVQFLRSSSERLKCIECSIRSLSLQTRQTLYYISARKRDTFQEQGLLHLADLLQTKAKSVHKFPWPPQTSFIGGFTAPLAAPALAT